MLLRGGISPANGDAGICFQLQPRSPHSSQSSFRPSTSRTSLPLISPRARSMRLEPQGHLEHRKSQQALDHELGLAEAPVSPGSMRRICAPPSFQLWPSSCLSEPPRAPYDVLLRTRPKIPAPPARPLQNHHYKVKSAAEERASPRSSIVLEAEVCEKDEVEDGAELFASLGARLSPRRLTSGQVLFRRRTSMQGMAKKCMEEVEAEEVAASTEAELRGTGTGGSTLSFPNTNQRMRRSSRAQVRFEAEVTKTLDQEPTASVASLEPATGNVSCPPEATASSSQRGSTLAETMEPPGAAPSGAIEVVAPQPAEEPASAQELVGTPPRTPAQLADAVSTTAGTEQPSMEPQVPKEPTASRGSYKRESSRGSLLRKRKSSVGKSADERKEGEVEVKPRLSRHGTGVLRGVDIDIDLEDDSDDDGNGPKKPTAKPLRSPLQERLKRLELRNGHRKQMARHAKELEAQRKKFNELPREDVDAINRGFMLFDEDSSGTLDQDEVFACLRELGLRGSNTAEKREILKICIEATEALRDMQIVIPGVDPVKKSRTELTEESEVPPEEEEEPEAKVSIDLLTLALVVVPQVRATFQEFRSNELLRQFNAYDRNGTGVLRSEHCLEIARALGVDKRDMKKIIQEVTTAQDTGITFELFQLMIARCWEQVERTICASEHRIKGHTGISDRMFQHFRDDIVNLFDVFQHFDKDKSGKLCQEEIMSAMGEFGLLPKNPLERKEVEAILKAADKNGDNAFDFEEFLHLTSLVRNYQVDLKREEHSACFDRYDRDKSGSLTVEELSSLLYDLGCIPRDRKEQEELGAIIQQVDSDGNGIIQFDEFEILCQRIDERLKSMRYEEEIEYALSIGFSETQLLDLRYVFDSLDADCSCKLDANEVRVGLSMMKKHVSQEAFENAFRALDVDGSGELDFLEFLDFMRMLRDGEGIFGGQQDDSQSLPARVKMLETRILRRVLDNFGISKTYLTSLSFDELVELFCGFFDCNSNDNVQEKFGVNSLCELFEFAKVRAKEVAPPQPF
mmetsp:Transcript_130084/g.277889  ORF Transcript_130084/g.277889 Transcript_130084/m.277889 type:complete len:1026 (+) Transcript_130084:91-3168(+)